MAASVLLSACGSSGGADDGPSAGVEVPVYEPRSDVMQQGNITLDLRDIRGILDSSSDWAAVQRIYFEGKNSRAGSGPNAGTGAGTGGGGGRGTGGGGGSGGATGLRALRGLGTTSTVLDQFPEREKVYGNASFIDANLVAAIAASGRANGLSDGARRSIVEQSALAVLYGKVLQEVATARLKTEAKQADVEGTATHNVDEAWSFYMGAKDDRGAHPYGIAAFVAISSERADDAVQAALSRLQAATESGDLKAFDAAAATIRANLNAGFYLHVLDLMGARSQAPEAQQVIAAEAWATWQTIRATVWVQDAKTADRVEALLTKTTLSRSEMQDVAKLLREGSVTKALALPKNVEQD